MSTQVANCHPVTYSISHVFVLINYGGKILCAFNVSDTLTQKPKMWKELFCEEYITEVR